MDGRTKFDRLRKKFLAENPTERKRISSRYLDMIFFPRILSTAYKSSIQHALLEEEQKEANGYIYIFLSCNILNRIHFFFHDINI